MEFSLSSTLAGALGVGAYSALAIAWTLRAGLNRLLQAHLRRSVANRGGQWNYAWKMRRI